ncbi:hypothetical protein FVQ98_14620 [Ottowia sp. GY511]|uniref:Uncharacterized protein n=1 Tax=Ottowia flava TaxID=2675430 RepID=A0ABW4KM19_9BURK|nr:hypothetical protein [Ottowia sp. GY511]TXK26388.1 hypothetical protein FVQ98_14620 [Ottowia sp. GY511]
MSDLATALLAKALGLPEKTTKAVITLERDCCPVVDLTLLVPSISPEGERGLEEVQRRCWLVEAIGRKEGGAR